MKRLTSIVALNAQGAIGCNNELPWRLKTDMQFFRAQTTGQVVIMGRKTHDSIGRPLRNRQNIVLSHNSVLFQKTEESEVATSVVEALVHASEKKRKEIFVIGGSSTYAQFSQFVDRYLITIVDKPVPGADAFFDESILNDEANWIWRKIDSLHWNPAVDDAEFEVFEVTSRYPEEFSLRRESVIAEYRSRYLNRNRAARKSFSTGGSATMEFQLR